MWEVKVDLWSKQCQICSVMHNYSPVLWFLYSMPSCYIFIGALICLAWTCPAFLSRVVLRTSSTNHVNVSADYCICRNSQEIFGHVAFTWMMHGVSFRVLVLCTLSPCMSKLNVSLDFGWVWRLETKVAAEARREVWDNRFILLLSSQDSRFSLIAWNAPRITLKGSQRLSWQPPCGKSDGRPKIYDMS